MAGMRNWATGTPWVNTPGGAIGMVLVVVVVLSVDPVGAVVDVVVVDDVVLAPMVPLDGTWYALVGGATAFVRGDTFTFTDADAVTRAKLSYWLWRAWEDDPETLLEMRGWFPTTAGTETIADP